MVDPELPSDAIVSASDKVRNAKVNAETHVRELNSVRPALRAAAVLAGMFECARAQDHDHDTPRHTTDRRHSRRTPSPRVGGMAGRGERASTRRQAAQGFSVTVPPPSRTGRWGGLVAAGATIRACPIGEFEIYRRPHPLQVKRKNTPAGPISITVDPEDEALQPTAMASG